MVAVIIAIVVCCAEGYALVIGPLVMKKSMNLVQICLSHCDTGNNATQPITQAAFSKAQTKSSLSGKRMIYKRCQLNKQNKFNYNAFQKYWDSKVKMYATAVHIRNCD